MGPLCHKRKNGGEVPFPQQKNGFFREGKGEYLPDLFRRCPFSAGACCKCFEPRVAELAVCVEKACSHFCPLAHMTVEKYFSGSRRDTGPECMPHVVAYPYDQFAGNLGYVLTAGAQDGAA